MYTIVRLSAIGIEPAPFGHRAAHLEEAGPRRVDPVFVVDLGLLLGCLQRLLADLFIAVNDVLKYAQIRSTNTPQNPLYSGAVTNRVRISVYRSIHAKT